ncbi:MAG: beta-galactosidase [Acidimicrobiia bacterium]|nr:beta-galactosidase [Acidimicrobiia bacterium]
MLSLDASGGHLPKIMDAYPVITSLHPAFLERVATWYDAVCEVLRPRQWTAGGPIISVEIDGEPSYWMTIPEALSSDYNPFITGPGGLFESWLRARYGSIRALNREYRARHGTFARRAASSDAATCTTRLSEAARLAPVQARHGQRIRCRGCMRYCLPGGIDVPLSLLDPYLDFDLEGWETFRAFCQERGLAILPTTEIYPSGVWESYRTSHIKEDAVQYVAGKLAIYRSLAQRLDAPRICVEAQAAATYRLDQDEADLLYHMLVAFGLDHLVYWTIPSGTNPIGWGRSFTGTVYDQSNAIGPDGRERPHYENDQADGHVSAGQTSR